MFITPNLCNDETTAAAPEPPDHLRQRPARGLASADAFLKLWIPRILPRPPTEACLSGQEAVGLTYPTLFAFLRISTNARIYANPLTLGEAAQHVRSWQTRRVSQILEPPGDHTEQVIALLEAGGRERTC